MRSAKEENNWLSMIATRKRVDRPAVGDVIAPAPTGAGGDQP